MGEWEYLWAWSSVDQMGGPITLHSVIFSLSGFIQACNQNGDFSGSTQAEYKPSLSPAHPDTLYAMMVPLGLGDSCLGSIWRPI